MAAESRRRWAVALAALLVAALTFRLGLWQLDRAAQKTALHEALVARGHLPALSAGHLARTADEGPPQHHRKVVVRGRWRNDLTVFLDNRQMNERPGFFVVTPLLLTDGDAVAVQRGWVPRDALDRTRVPDLPLPDGVVEVHGRIAPGLARLYDFGGDPPGRIRQNLDLSEWRVETGLPLLPVSIVQESVPGAPADGLGRDWTAPTPDVHKHHGYAFQWFALSALVTGLYVWFQLIVPRRRSR